MPDFDYTVAANQLYDGAAFDAFRQAVIFPLGKHRDPAQGYNQVTTEWRRRLLKLRQAGWAPLNPPLADTSSEAAQAAEGKGRMNLQYFRNCPPVGIRPRQAANRCNRPRICPWCYGREHIFASFNAMEYACFTALSDALSCYKLLALHRTLTDVPLLSRPWEGPKGWLTQIHDALRVFVNRLPSLGAVSQATLAPGRTPGTVTLHYGAILLVPREKPKPDFGATVAVRQAAPITRKNLGQALAWTFPYPLGMFYGEIDTTATILQQLAAHRTRMIQMRGVFNNRLLRQAARQPRAESLHGAVPEEE